MFLHYNSSRAIYFEMFKVHFLFGISDEKMTCDVQSRKEERQGCTSQC